MATPNKPETGTVDALQEMVDALRDTGLNVEVLSSGKVAVVPARSKVAGQLWPGTAVKVPYDTRTSDGMVIVEQTGQQIHAHAAELRKRSEFFKEVLSTDERNADSLCVPLEHVPSVDAFDITLKFLYTGRMPVQDTVFLNAQGAGLLLSVMKNAQFSSLTN